MRKRWIASLALSFGILATTARAGDDAWRVPVPKPAAAPTAQIGRPVAIDSDTPPPMPALNDNQVRPTAYDVAPLPPPPLMPVQASDARPMPVGSAVPAGPSGVPLATSGPAVSGPPMIKPVPVDNDTLSLPRQEISTPEHSDSFWSHLDPTIDGACGDSCGPCVTGHCPTGCCYSPYGCFYMSAESLLWWMKSNKVPALVTTGSPNDAVPGALGQPGTVVLFGNNNLGGSGDGGGRFTIGGWFTQDHCLGLEGSFWFLGTQATNFSASSLGNPPLFRPFTDETGAQNVELVAVPSPMGPGLAGTIAIQSKTSYWGADTDFRSALCCGQHWFLDGLAGFRTMGLDDTLNIHENLTYVVGATLPSGQAVPAGTNFMVNDRFSTTNNFYGGQIGLDWEYRLNNWIFGVKGKLAIGDTAETANVSGSTTISIPGVSTNTYNGGLLAQSSNIGHYAQNKFAVVPEMDLKIGYQFNEHWRAYIGYNAIYWSNVARAGSQIDVNVNRNLIPPPVGAGSTPAFAFQTTSFWVQGASLGLEFIW